MFKSNICGSVLAKTVLQVCQNGESVTNKAINHQKLKELLANAKQSIVEIEGCASSNYYRRYAKQFGHEVRIINPNKSKRFPSRSKN